MEFVRLVVVCSLQQVIDCSFKLNRENMEQMFTLDNRITVPKPSKGRYFSICSFHFFETHRLGPENICSYATANENRER